MSNYRKICFAKGRAACNHPPDHFASHQTSLYLLKSTFLGAGLTMRFRLGQVELKNMAMECYGSKQDQRLLHVPYQFDGVSWPCVFGTFMTQIHFKGIFDQAVCGPVE